MTLAERARAAARAHPFLVEALRADIVNYAAAGRFLGVEGDDEAVATALRRFAEDLPALDAGARDARVRMESGVGTADSTADGDPLLAVGGTALVADGGDRTAVLATGDVDAAALRSVLGHLAVDDVPVDAAGVAGDALVVVTARRHGAGTLRAVENALEAVPS